MLMSLVPFERYTPYSSSALTPKSAPFHEKVILELLLYVPLSMTILSIDETTGFIHSDSLFKFAISSGLASQQHIRSAETIDIDRYFIVLIIAFIMIAPYLRYPGLCLRFSFALSSEVGKSKTSL